LWRASITTGGAITLTDERGYLQPPIQVITDMLAAGVLSADVTGRAKMADGFLSADAGGRAKMADLFITTAKLAAGALSADAAGRALMASSYFNAATVLAKFGTDSFTNAVLLQLIQDGAFAADANTQALFANLFMPNAKLALNAQHALGDIKANRLATLGGTGGRRMVVGGVTYESWVHCDGGAAVNGITIPDYRGKVVAGASAGHAAGTTGGADAADISHAHAVGTLAGAATQAGNHNHSIAAAGTVESVQQSGLYSHTPDHNHGGLTGSTNPAAHSHALSGNTATAGSATQDMRQATAYEYVFIYVG